MGSEVGSALMALWAARMASVTEGAASISSPRRRAAAT